MRRVNTLSKYYKIMPIIGISIFLPDLLKFFIKGADGIDKVVLLVEIIIYIGFLIIFNRMKKNIKLKLKLRR